MPSAAVAQVLGGRGLVAAVGALAACGSLAGCASGGGGGSDEIAQGSAQIFVADVAGRKVEKLTDDDDRHECPRWSPDGRRLAWRAVVGHDASEAGRLELATAAGDVRGVEGDMAPGTCASWSPDGRRVAFFGISSGARELVSIDATAPERRVAVRAVVAPTGEPSWSPDGRSLVFSVLRPAPCPPRYRCPRTAPRPGLPPPVSQGDLSIAVPAAGEERLLTNSPTVIELFPSFSPDGSSIAFERGTIRRGAPAGPPSLALMRRDGGGTRTLLRGSAHGGGLVPKWSPNGRWIAAVSTDMPGGVVQIVAPSGRPAGRIEANGDVAWSRRGDVLAVPTDGGVELFRPRERSWRQIVQQPPSTYIQHVAISPDGRTVAYADQHGVKLKDVMTGPSRILFRIRSDEAVDDIAWSPDGRRIVFGVERQSAPT
jgi:Tol biopolymer transport system component